METDQTPVCVFDTWHLLNGQCAFPEAAITLKSNLFLSSLSRPTRVGAERVSGFCIIVYISSVA